VKYFDGYNVREFELGAASRTYSLVFESLKERDHLKGLGVDGHIILECTLKWDGKA
jgi:hypothetical protein